MSDVTLTPQVIDEIGGAGTMQALLRLAAQSGYLVGLREIPKGTESYAYWARVNRHGQGVVTSLLQLILADFMTTPVAGQMIHIPNETAAEIRFAFTGGWADAGLAIQHGSA